MTDTMRLTVADVLAIEDPLQRAALCDTAMDEARQLIATFAKLRRDSLADAVKTLGSKAAVAQALGISRQAVGQALNED